MDKTDRKFRVVHRVELSGMFSPTLAMLKEIADRNNVPYESLHIGSTPTFFYVEWDTLV